MTSSRARAKDAARKLVRGMNKRYQIRRATHVATVSSVSKDSQGRVTAAVGSIGSLSNVKIRVGFNAPIGKHSQIVVENRGTASDPDWCMAEAVGGMAPAVGYLVNSGGAPIVTPAGAVQGGTNLFRNGGFDVKDGLGHPVGWISSEYARLVGSIVTE